MSTSDYFTEKGEKRKSIEGIKNLLLANKFTIANFADVTEAFVFKVKAMM